MTDPDSWWGQVSVEDRPEGGARYTDELDPLTRPAPASRSADDFAWGNTGQPEDAPVVDDLLQVRRFNLPRILVAGAVAVAVALGAGWAVMTFNTGPAPDPAPTSTTASLQTGALSYGQAAPGFSRPQRWSFDIPAGAKIAGTQLGLVVVFNHKLSLYSPADGSEMVSFDLAEPVESMTTAKVDGQLSLAWLSGGKLSWWSQIDQMQQAKAGWATGLSSAGGQLLVSSGSRTAVVEAGELVEVPLDEGQVALASTDKGVVAVSSAGMFLVNPDADRTTVPIALVAPNPQDNRPVRWAGVADGFVAVVWSPVPSPGPGQKVTVALHRLDGTVTGMTSMPYQVAAQATWMRTMGQQVGTFERAAFSLTDGSLLLECSTCTLSGGFGTLVQAADAGMSGFVSGTTLYPSDLTVLALADGMLLAREGSTVKGFPAG